MKRIRWLFFSTLLSLLMPWLCRAQTPINGVVTISVSNSPTNITVDRTSYFVAVRENAASPTAVFSITLTGTSVAQNFPAGAVFVFNAPNGQPFQKNQTIGTIVATTSGPFTFTATESTSAQPSMQAKVGTGGSAATGVTSVATTSPITGGPITASGTIACATCATAAASLTLGQILEGAGSQALGADSSLDDGVTTASTLTYKGSGGLAVPNGPVTAGGAGSGQFGLKGSTSGTATCTAPAIAGTVTNPVTCTNVFATPTSNPIGTWWSNYQGGVPATGTVFSNTANRLSLAGFFISNGVISGHISYEIGTTADNTAATYDIGFYTGSSGGTCTLLADIGPTAGTTFSPAASTFETLAWAQGTVVIPPGRVYFATTTSQTGTPATMFKISTMTGLTAGAYQFTLPAITIATGGTLPASFTCPADSNSGAGLTIQNPPAVTLQP